MRKIFCFILLIEFSTMLFAQKIQSAAPNNILKPTLSKSGIILTDSQDSKLYVLQNDKAELLASSPGSGKYFSISKDQTEIGFKYIDEYGNQTPAVINPSTKRITYLSSPAKEAGQVSFADDGSIAFTIGNELVIKYASGEKKFDLGNYSNIAPISPGAKYDAFNDNSDQLYILNINSGVKKRITDDSCGYFHPQWSPDGSKLLYSSLAGVLKVYNIENGKTFYLGKGFSPSWSNESDLIIFYRKEIKKEQLINSDIYVINSNGSGLRCLTSTAGQLEVDPSFNSNDTEIIYSLLGSSKIVEAEFSSTSNSLNILKEESVNISISKAPLINSFESTEDVDTLNIPYINQLYDTPDNFNGSAACGPTSAMMVVTYYNILPPWNINCSWPSSHKSEWGRYIAQAYSFRQQGYAYQAEDPNGNEAKGVYGFMWTSNNDPYATMVNFFKYNGMNASRADAPSYNDALQQVNSGKPYVICVGLTPPGHIVVAHGTASQEHTLIFNDPYGNKNTGYPNYSGKNVKYDWPGYNNGYQNLNEVYWSVSVNYTPQTVADTLIDDLDFGKGFYLNTNSPASMNIWKDLNEGYDDHMWFTYTTSSSTTDTCYATWTPNLPKAGYYKVSAYIPMSQAEDADYKVYNSGGMKEVPVDQKQYTNAWASLGVFHFSQGSSGYVRLGDASGIKGQAIIFDAMKWAYVDSSGIKGVSAKNITPAKFLLEQNYPNPFNPTTTIKYAIPKAEHVTLKVFDELGREVATLVNDNISSGEHSITYNASNLASGIYYYRIIAGGLNEVKKFMLLK
jgi:Secretion system C-terminal sorting domain/Peptidase_C39 like family